MPQQRAKRATAGPSRVVDDRRIGAECNSASTEDSASTDIGIFAVHEEFLVESSERAESFGAEQEKHPRNPRGSPEVRARRANAAKQHIEWRQQTSGAVFELPVRVHHGRCRHRSAGAQRAQKHGERVLLQANVGIADGEMTFDAPLERFIVVPAESLRCWIAHHLEQEGRRRRKFNAFRDVAGDNHSFECRWREYNEII